MTSALAFYKEENHSKENWKAYQDALAAVKAVLDNDKATQKEVEDALGQLVKITEKMNKELKDDSGVPQKPSNPSGTDSSLITQEKFCNPLCRTGL